MKREIKFRRWDTDEKYMYYDRPFHMSGRFDRFIYMQYTGLKDKNGKEIYEGDVVRIANYNENWKHGEPEFDWRVVEVIHNKYVYALENSVIYSPFSSYSGNTLEEYDIEVMGNIYENPELLKV
jgi:uncharacterized phage protein (TIGR01671 family)